MSDTINFLGKEYDDSPLGAASLYAHAFDPRNIGDVFTDPSPTNLAQIGFVPAHGYVAAQLVAFAVGERIAWYELLFHNLDMKKRSIKHVAPHLARATPYLAGAAVTGGTIHALETGDTRYTIQHQMMMPFISNWLSGLGQNDTRGGREYSLF